MIFNICSRLSAKLTPIIPSKFVGRSLLGMDKNFDTFMDFLAKMVEKYGDDVLKEIEKEKEVQKESA